MATECQDPAPGISVLEQNIAAPAHGTARLFFDASHDSIDLEGVRHGTESRHHPQSTPDTGGDSHDSAMQLLTSAPNGFTNLSSDLRHLCCAPPKKYPISQGNFSPMTREDMVMLVYGARPFLTPRPASPELPRIGPQHRRCCWFHLR